MTRKQFREGLAAELTAARPSLEEAVDRLRRHRQCLAALRATRHSDVFGWQMGGSPYYDPEWGHCTQAPIDVDLDVVAEAATGVSVYLGEFAAPPEERRCD